MATKKEKIVSQELRQDFLDSVNHDKYSGRQYHLEELKFHSIVWCDSANRQRLQRRIMFVPNQIKLIYDLIKKQETQIYSLKNINYKLDQDLKLLQVTSVTQASRVEIEHKAEIKRLKKIIEDETYEMNERLVNVNEMLMKNIEDASLDEKNRPKGNQTYSKVFEEVKHMLKGLPYEGGLPSLGK